MAVLIENKPLDTQETFLFTEDCNTGPHELTFDNYKQTVTVRNGEAVPLTVNLSGDGVTVHVCPTYGPIDVSAGYDLVIGVGETVAVDLSRIGAYLGTAGNVVTLTVTGSTAPGLAEMWLSKY